MKKTILIAPFDGPLAASLAAAASEAGWSVALALAHGPSTTPPEATQGVVTITYDPRSYVSASSLVLSAMNALGELDAAVLVLSLIHI